MIRTLQCLLSDPDAGAASLRSAPRGWLLSACHRMSSLDRIRDIALIYENGLLKIAGITAFHLASLLLL